MVERFAKTIFNVAGIGCFAGQTNEFRIVAFFIYEIAGKGLEQKPYLPSFSLSSNLPILDPADTWNAVFQGFWPELKKATETERSWFLDH